MAVRDVVEATNGMSELAATAGKNRENLYRILSEEGNPRLDSLWAIFAAMGLRIAVQSIVPIEEKASEKSAEHSVAGFAITDPLPSRIIQGSLFSFLFEGSLGSILEPIGTQRASQNGVGPKFETTG
jgi:hypothetical protein